MSSEDSKLAKVIVGIVVTLLLLILTIAAWPFVIIRQEEKGLVFNVGKLQQETLQPGFHVITPFVQDVEKVSIRPQQLDFEVEVGAGGAITKDNQTIGADLTIFYKYDEQKLIEMWTNPGPVQLKSLAASALRESFKEVIGEYTIFDIATSQAEIRSKVNVKLVDKMKAYPVSITELRVQNYDWAESFDAQIATTMQKAQMVKQAEQDLLFAEQNSKKQVKEADAQKTALIVKAEGEKAAAALRADAKALEGEGIKKYNASIAQNLDVQIRLLELEIEKARIDKWNGAYVANNNYMPIPFNYGTTQR